MTNDNTPAPCPHCGYCPHCGRSNLQAPGVPYYTYPTTLYPYTITSNGITSTTISGTS